MDTSLPKQTKVKVAWKVAIIIAVLMMKKRSFSLEEFEERQWAFIRDHVSYKGDDIRRELRKRLIKMVENDYFKPNRERPGIYEVTPKLYDEWEWLHQP